MKTTALDAVTWEAYFSSPIVQRTRLGWVFSRIEWLELFAMAYRFGLCRTAYEAWDHEYRTCQDLYYCCHSVNRAPALHTDTQWAAHARNPGYYEVAWPLGFARTWNTGQLFAPSEILVLDMSFIVHFLPSLPFSFASSISLKAALVLRLPPSFGPLSTSSAAAAAVCLDVRSGTVVFCLCTCGSFLGDVVDVDYSPLASARQQQSPS
jgi:hypothetical protein